MTPRPPGFRILLTTTMASSRTGPLEAQPHDTLALVLSFLDHDSIAVFSQETSSPLTLRFASDSFNHVWRSIFHRHYFAPSVESSSEVDYIQECTERRKLVQTLVGMPSKLLQRKCFSLPNRHFYFVPILPNDTDDILMTMDPPPVDFDCSSFLLTSPGVDGELILLDPFDMSLVVYKNCLDNAVASDEGMMVHAMLSAATAVSQQRHDSHYKEREEHIAGAVIEDAVHRNHNVHDYPSQPSQVIIDAQSYFEVNLAEYFMFTENRNARRRTPEGMLLLHAQDEVDFGYIGIEAKPIVGKSGEVNGSMIGLGRILTSLQVDGGGAFPQDSDISCTEFVTWRKRADEDAYGDLRICRVPWYILCADTCTLNNRMYIVFYRGQGPALGSAGAPEDFLLDDTADASSPVGRKTVMAYPLLPAKDTDTPATSPRYFPTPEFSITCSDFVSYVNVDCMGTLVVGTENGTIEVWRPNKEEGLSRVALVKSEEALMEAGKRLTAETEGLSSKAEDVAMDAHVIEINSDEEDEQNRESIEVFDSDDGDEGHPVAIQIDSDDEDEEPPGIIPIERDDEDEGQPQIVRRLLGSHAIDSFHFPSHLSIDKCGFVSMHHSRVEGTTLLLWKKANGDDEFQVVSRINLPLSTRRKPRIHYDGRRIVVLGQDHIGVIILVYRVFSSNEDADYFTSNGEQKQGDESGGIYNYSIVRPQARFANRIRHAALGGLERFEDMFMTCNERYIIVNTKTGNLLGGGASPTGDGLLVIDLKEH